MQVVSIRIVQCLLLASLFFVGCTKPNEQMNNCENDSWDKLAEFFNKNLK